MKTLFLSFLMIALSYQSQTNCIHGVSRDPENPTDVNLEFTWIKNQKLTLYGRSVGISDNDIMTNEMELNPKEFLSGFDISSNQNQANAGMVIEKSMEITIDQFLMGKKKTGIIY